MSPRQKCGRLSPTLNSWCEAVVRPHRESDWFLIRVPVAPDARVRSAWSPLGAFKTRDDVEIHAVPCAKWLVLERNPRIDFNCLCEHRARMLRARAAEPYWSRRSHKSCSQLSVQQVNGQGAEVRNQRLARIRRGRRSPMHQARAHVDENGAGACIELKLCLLL